MTDNRSDIQRGTPSHGVPLTSQIDEWQGRRSFAAAHSRSGGTGAPASRTSNRLRPQWARLAGDLLTGLLAILFLSALAATIGPAFLPYRTYAVMSGSMAPQIPVGALVVDVRAGPDQLRPGDIVSFQRPDNSSQVVTHRIVEVDHGPAGTVYRTRGDANGAPDDWTVTAGPRTWRTAVTLPLVGYALVYLRTPLGQLLAVLLPAVALGLMALQDLWRRPRPRPAAVG